MSRHAPFALAVLFSALAAVNPALWPWVIGCLVVLGLAWLGTRAARAGSGHGFAGRDVLAVLVVLVVLVAAGAAALTVLDGGGGDSSSSSEGPAVVEIPLELPARLEATARYAARGKESLSRDERLTFTAATLNATAADLLRGAREAARRARAEENRFLSRFPDRASRRELYSRRGLRDRLDLPPAPSMFRHAVPDLATAYQRLSAILRRGLRADHWTLELDNNRRTTFVRTVPPRPLDRAGFLPSERTNELVAAAPQFGNRLGHDRVLGDPIVNVSLAFDDRSKVTLERMPENAVGATFPAAERDTHPRDGSEDLAFGLEESTRDATIEFDVRSPPFRNVILVRIVDLSLWSGINWILVLLMMSTNDWARGLPGRLVKRLRSRPSPA